MDFEKELLELKAKVEEIPGQENKLSMVVFSGFRCSNDMYCL